MSDANTVPTQADLAAGHTLFYDHGDVFGVASDAYSDALQALWAERSPQSEARVHSAEAELHRLEAEYHRKWAEHWQALAESAA